MTSTVSPIRVLVVCTANVCRSPMAAALLAHYCAQAGVDVTVTSAGTQGGYNTLDPDAARAMQERGLDIGGHQSRALTRDVIDIDGEHLIVAMTREQLRVVATTVPGAFRRAFTAKELARRVVALDDVTLAALNVGRSASELMGDDTGDDVADPFGHSLDEHRRCAGELDEAMRVIAVALAGGGGR